MVITFSGEDMRVRMKRALKGHPAWMNAQPCFFRKPETNEYRGSQYCQARWGTKIGSQTTRLAHHWQTVKNNLLDSSQSCFSKCNLSQLHTAYTGWDCWIWARINQTTDVHLVSCRICSIHCSDEPVISVLSMPVDIDHWDQDVTSPQWAKFR